MNYPDSGWIECHVHVDIAVDIPVVADIAVGKSAAADTPAAAEMTVAVDIPVDTVLDHNYRDNLDRLTIDTA